MSKRPRGRKTTAPSSLLAPIVGYGAMAEATSGGRLVPILILDRQSRPEVAEVIRLHEFTPPGDVLSQWATSRDNADDVFLHLEFTAPMEVELLLRFNIVHQAVVVEGILATDAVWLQAGTTGDTVSSTMETARIMAEVPSEDFRSIWDRVLLKRMTQTMGQRLQVSRPQARAAAHKLIGELREIADARFMLDRDV